MAPDIRPSGLRDIPGSGTMDTVQSVEFLERARHEAARYGSDPWVFVREVLQNSRDAGAHNVQIEAREGEGVARVVFTDDGAGMTFEHARRFLFTLYASSKERDRGAAGRFGVGFWSVLRFDPARIVVRSWPRRGTPWEIELDGTLSQAVTRTPGPRRGSGTEVLLERRSGDGDLARRVRDAAWQSGRFLARRDDRRRALDVRVNGAAVNAPFELPAPSASFRKGRLRGVVALGSEARVELFSQGLRVRAASGLEDLLSPEGWSEQTRVHFPSLAEGVAPQALLDGDELEPLLARGDVRDTPRLRRVVALGQRELRRLIERQIDAIRPRPLLERARQPLLIAAGLLLIGALGAALARWVPWRAMSPAAPNGPPGRAGGGSRPSIAAAEPAAERDVLVYRDFRAVYAGPRSEAFPITARPLALTYEPPTASLHLAVLVLERPFEPPPSPVDAGPYDAPAVEAERIDIRVAIDDGPGPLRLPLPTGHRLDPASVRLNGRAAPVRVSAFGEPFVDLERRVTDVVTYRTGPGRGTAPALSSPPPSLPPALADIARRLAAAEPARRVAEATEWVATRVAYSTAPDVAARHRAAAAAGRDVLSAALDIGAADCDVQNSVLVTLLRATGTDARLAVGYVAAGGVALAPPHAWVEWRAGEEAWRVADATLVVPRPGAPPPETPVVGGGLTVVVGVVPRGESWASAAARPWVAASAGLAGALTLGALAIGFVRTRRVVRLAPQQDMAALLQGALQRPEAFRDIPVLFRRPLLPCLDGRRVSLADAWQRAADRRLFRSAGRSELARRSSRAGACVLDTTRPDGRAVADALGATDLDEWDSFLAGTRRTPLLEAVARRLRALGEPWELRAMPGLHAPAVLDLPSAGGGVARIVVLDADADWLRAAEARRAARPGEAILAVADRLAEIVRWGDADRRALLRPLARDALREARP